MSEFVWHVYQSGQQMGPFSDAQVRQLLNIKMISQDASIFKEGWDDWRAISEIFGEKGAVNERKKIGNRAKVSGSDIIANSAHISPPQLEASDALKMPQLGVAVSQTDKSDSSKKRKNRIGLQGKVIAHNNGRVIISGGINISASGIFVETVVENKDPSFKVGELIKLTVKADDLSYPFNVMAEMMRFSYDSNYPSGYGMKFIDLPVTIRDDIEKLATSR